MPFNYKIPGPVCISFSGGRTSAKMLKKFLDAHGGALPADYVVIFANTGKEIEQSLEFVRDCSIYWGVPIVWLELADVHVHTPKKSGGRKRFEYFTRVVTFETASRNGEPFEILLNARGSLPNPVSRFCTADLKIRRMQDYMHSIGYREFDSAVGIRYDEPVRAHKLIGKRPERGSSVVLPLWHDRITKHDVGNFWKSQPFDLKLPNNNGTTDWGNCDLCFLKGLDKKASIIRERPSLGDWWRDQEQRFAGYTFRRDHPNYSNLIAVSRDQDQIFEFADDESIPCFCGE